MNEIPSVTWWDVAGISPHFVAICIGFVLGALFMVIYAKSKT